MGAGKTTLINRILEENKSVQFAIAENEFGDVSIDTQLLRGVDTSRMFELRNGCICCTISNEFELVLLELAERFPQVDHLLIETTGLADPVNVIRPFFAEPEVLKRFCLNGTVCVADALNFEKSPEYTLAEKQVAVSDLLLISKAETLSSHEKNRLRLKLSRINPFAEILLSKENTNADLLERVKKAGQIKKIYPEKPAIHLESISTKTLVFENPLPKTEFLQKLEYFLYVHRKQIYRAKGILCFEGEPFRFVLQAVGGTYLLEEGDLIQKKCTGAIVFIGNLEGVRFSEIQP